jgi:hypothetical protein
MIKWKKLLCTWAETGHPNKTGPTVPGLVTHLAETGDNTTMAQGGGGAGRNLVNWRRARFGEEVLEGLWSVGDPI